MKRLLSLLILPIVASTAIAEPVTVDAPLGFTPVSAIGVVFSATNSEEVAEVQISQPSTGRYSFTFTGHGDTTSFVTVLARSASGEEAYTPVAAFDAAAARAARKIPLCPARGAGRKLDPSKYGALEAFVSTRRELLSTYRDELNDLLTEDTLKSLQRIEQAFGLAEGKAPLSSQLPALELVDRLSRIQATLTGYTQ